MRVLTADGAGSAGGLTASLLLTVAFFFSAASLEPRTADAKIRARVGRKNICFHRKMHLLKIRTIVYVLIGRMTKKSSVVVLERYRVIMNLFSPLILLSNVNQNLGTGCRQVIIVLRATESSTRIRTLDLMNPWTLI